MSCNSSGESEPKKPCKGILKSSSSFDKHSVTAMHRKSAKFDELNVLQTYHPPDKDYGHMKIEEPKTPYNYMDSSISLDQLDAEVLAEKLKVAASARMSSFSSEDDSGEDTEPETEEQKAKRLEFEKRRKAHYKEFEAVKLARKLIEEEEDDEDDEEGSSKKSPQGDNKSDPEAGGSTSTASLRDTTIP
ncbi:protein phosphatase inhibitor 2 [Phlebotomus argentipes]|uniref:protein phosphatase inhibitor 2 n=1 Tax=Phlebotomus argentipes TaxID=94469 RepID=UPI00289319F9|nr:protein phosphatase inhibitor 2 [Phlebotomus argentipes]